MLPRSLNAHWSHLFVEFQSVQSLSVMWVIHIRWYIWQIHPRTIPRTEPQTQVGLAMVTACHACCCSVSLHGGIWSLRWQSLLARVCSLVAKALQTRPPLCHWKQTMMFIIHVQLTSPVTSLVQSGGTTIQIVLLGSVSATSEIDNEFRHIIRGVHNQRNYSTIKHFLIFWHAILDILATTIIIMIALLRLDMHTNTPTFPCTGCKRRGEQWLAKALECIDWRVLSVFASGTFFRCISPNGSAVFRSMQSDFRFLHVAACEQELPAHPCSCWQVEQLMLKWEDCQLLHLN